MTTTFDLTDLGPVARAGYNRLLERGEVEHPCMFCKEKITLEQFENMVESGGYDNHQLAEACMYGFHPECSDPGGSE